MSLTGKTALTTSAPVTNDGFWPDLQVADLLNKYRIPSEYVDGLIMQGLLLAVIRVNATLAPVKQAMIDLGHADLAAYTTANSEQLGGKELLLTEYENAVFCRAKAGLLQQFKTINRREIAENEAKEAEETEQYWLNESQASIAVFFNKLLPLETTLNNANAHVVLL